jgi:hypothetical protein
MEPRNDVRSVCEPLLILDVQKSSQLVWRQVTRLVTIGLTVGSAGAFAVGRLLTTLAGEIPASIPGVVAGACCALRSAALAAVVSAGNAASVDPIEGLRSE